MKKKSFLLISAILILLGINFGNEPSLPPYYKFTVTGTVLCDSLVDKSNFTIQLYGKSNNYQNSYEPILNSGLDFEIPLTLTDTAGHYFLIVNNEFFYDSIKIALFGFRNQIIFSEPYYINKDLNLPIETLSDDIETTSGCSSCSTEPTKVKKIIRYEYNLATTISYCN